MIQPPPKAPTRGAVCLAVPTHAGQLSTQTAQSILKATRRHPVAVHFGKNSLLPHGFNLAWCQAIAAGFDYFAMIHADVFAAPYWLDTLLEILTSRRAAVVAGHVAIKDASDTVSTAWQGTNGQPHKLTGDELAAMPTTISRKHVKKIHPGAKLLLLNTGLFVADLRGTWPRNICFEFRTAVTWRGDDVDVAVDPEDWQFSRQLAGLDLADDIYATSAALAGHVGQAIF